MNSLRFSISTWSLHGLLGSGMPLLDVPAQVADHGIRSLEVCHFHFPATDAAYLSAFQAALRQADVEMSTLLIDDGDVAAPDPRERETDLTMIRGWIEAASVLGAKSVRVGAGLQHPTEEVVERSASSLFALARFADDLHVKTITENWRTTGLQAKALLEILDRCDGRVGLLADIGNAEGPDKYETLRLLLPRASSVHFKAQYGAQGEIDLNDLDRCAALVRDANFDGPVTLIYGDTEDEWAGVDRLKDALTRAFGDSVSDKSLIEPITTA